MSKKTVKTNKQKKYLAVTNDPIKILREIKCFIESNEAYLGKLKDKEIYQMFASDPIVINLAKKVRKVGGKS